MRVGVLISGRGSNLRALLESCSRPDMPACIVQVVSDRPQAAGLQFAGAAGVATAVIEGRGQQFESRVNQTLRDAAVDVVCLAGCMRILSPGFVDLWHNRLLNIHPSLLPAFQGLNAHVRAVAAGVRWSGCTVHFVRAAVDQGPIIIQAVTPVQPSDTPEILAERVLALEHRCYPQALRLLAQGRVRVVGDRVQVKNFTPFRSPGFLNPRDPEDEIL